MRQAFDLRSAQKWMTPREVAEALGVTPEAIRLRVRKGRLGQRFCGRLVISREEFELLTVRRRKK